LQQTSTDCKIKLLKNLITVTFLTGVFLSSFHTSYLMSLKMTDLASDFSWGFWQRHWLKITSVDHHCQ